MKVWLTLGMLAFPTTVFAASEASVLVVGNVPTVCEVSTGDNKGSSTLAFEIDAAGASPTTEIVVNCNVPMRGEVTADKGGLVNDVAVAGAYTGGLQEIEYTVAVDFPSLPLFGPYESDMLVRGATFDSGQTVLFEETATVRINLASSEALYAGDYTDTLTFRVEPME